MTFYKKKRKIDHRHQSRIECSLPNLFLFQLKRSRLQRDVENESIQLRVMKISRNRERNAFSRRKRIKDKWRTPEAFSRGRTEKTRFSADDEIIRARAASYIFHGHRRNHGELKRGEKLATRPECRVYPRKEPVYSRLEPRPRFLGLSRCPLLEDSRSLADEKAKGGEEKHRRGEYRARQFIVPRERNLSTLELYCHADKNPRRSNFSFDSTSTANGLRQKPRKLSIVETLKETAAQTASC